MALRRVGRPRAKVSKPEQQLMARILDGSMTVGIVGLGYVGLPLALEFAKSGVRTIGIDVSAEKIKSLQAGKNYIQDLDDDAILDVVKRSKMLTATTEFAATKDCDVIYICVPTPFTPNKDPDISHVVHATEGVAKHLRKGQLIILKSTTFPGTTEKYVKPILDAAKLECGKEYFLAFSPERIDPGNSTWTTKNTPVVVGGVTSACTDLAIAVNRRIINEVVPVSTPAVAEMEKLLENIFRSVNIALVNELAQLCDRLGINIWEVVDAAKTKPFGFMPFYPGPGIGGHCILIDPYYLAWAAREVDFVTNFITLAAEVNESMPFYVRAMIEREIAKQPVTLKNARVLLLGMAFKKDVDDLRHSPALKVAELLLEDGIDHVSYFDPFIPSVDVHGKNLTSRKTLTAAFIKKHDVVVITTDHSMFDVDMIVQNAKVVIDTRNATRNVRGPKKNIVLLGDGK
ncbi:MAG: nucleotide sugar dehydrogenase [Candidatus Kapabacteria bacterium]|nr:nucleotide sugar dehydrogenase [Candidatus Kapabacteria bacterium]